MNKEIDELLLKSGTATTNASTHAEVGALLLLYGYTPERIDEGKTLCTNATALYQQQIKERGDQTQASSDLNKAIDIANDPYIDQLKIARIVFRNEPGMWTKLELSGKRKCTQSGWINQAKIFYTNLLADEAALSKMAVYGSSVEKLESEAALVADAEAKQAIQRREMGEAQEATLKRDQAIEALDDWYSDFRKIARIALKTQPQYLEMLGIVEPS